MKRLFIVGALAALAGCHTSATRPLEDLPYYDDPDFTPHWTAVMHRLGEFSLTTQTGRQVSQADLAGRIHVASFMFTSCPSLCPTLVRELKRVQDATAGVPGLTIVSYSVTPGSDTPARLAEFGREHGIDASRWMLLTGEPSTIASLARRSYFADDPRLVHEATGAGDQLLHTEKLLLVDEAGRLRGVYNGTMPFDVNRLIDDIRTLGRRRSTT